MVLRIFERRRGNQFVFRLVVNFEFTYFQKILNDSEIHYVTTSSVKIAFVHTFLFSSSKTWRRELAHERCGGYFCSSDGSVIPYEINHGILCFLFICFFLSRFPTFPVTQGSLYNYIMRGGFHFFR